MMESKNDVDILFVGNFSNQLNITINNIISSIPNGTTYTALTYRKSSMDKFESYEDFLAEYYEFIDLYNMEDIEKEYLDVNLFLSVVSERFISNYYSGIESTLGNKVLKYTEIMFFLKSYILFLSPKIKNSKIIFTGYADNFISTLTYYLCKHYNKKCFSFLEISVINNNSNFIVEGIYGEPYNDLIINPETKSCLELEEFMNKFDGEKDRKDRAKKNVTMKKGLWGVFSPNIFNIEYLKFAYFGYKVNEKLFKFMNIDKPDLRKKFIANIYRVVNKVVVSKYIKNFKFNINENTKYIYFPLQVQPEASTSSRSPFYMNLMSTIELISKSLPLGYKLIVKEHPLCIGMRSISFYRRLKHFPNVEFINNEMTGKEIIKLSKLVISFGGTTLFESINMGKKVLMLMPKYFYSDSTLIFKVTNQNDLYLDIVSALKCFISKEEKEVEKEKMLNFFYQRGFPRFENFEKNIAENLIKILRMENVNDQNSLSK